MVPASSSMSHGSFFFVSGVNRDWIAADRLRGPGVAARCAPDTQVDAPRIERLEHAKCLRGAKRAVVGQQHAAGADLSRTWALVPIRGLETAKTRLGGGLDAEERRDLVVDLLRRTLVATRDATRVSGTIVGPVPVDVPVVAGARNTAVSARPDSPTSTSATAAIRSHVRCIRVSSLCGTVSPSLLVPAPRGRASNPRGDWHQYPCERCRVLLVRGIPHMRAPRGRGGRPCRAQGVRRRWNACPKSRCPRSGG